MALVFSSTGVGKLSLGEPTITTPQTEGSAPSSDETSVDTVFESSSDLYYFSAPVVRKLESLFVELGEISCREAVILAVNDGGNTVTQHVCKLLRIGSKRVQIFASADACGIFKTLYPGDPVLVNEGDAQNDHFRLVNSPVPRVVLAVPMNHRLASGRSSPTLCSSDVRCIDEGRCFVRGACDEEVARQLLGGGGGGGGGGGSVATSEKTVDRDAAAADAGTRGPSKKRKTVAETTTRQPITPPLGPGLPVNPFATVSELDAVFDAFMQDVDLQTLLKSIEGTFDPLNDPVIMDACEFVLDDDDESWRQDEFYATLQRMSFPK